MDELQIINQDGKLYANSREIATMVKKDHAMLMRDIRKYVKVLTTAKLQALDFFVESSYTDAKGETRPCYLISRKGCDMVANKMTGDKGIIFTAKYVTKFEEMEKQLKNQQSTFKDPLEIAHNLLEMSQKYIESETARREAESKLEIATPKAIYFDALVDKNTSSGVRDTAKLIGVGQKKFVNFLLTNKFCFRDNRGELKPYAEYINSDKSYFELKDWQTDEHSGQRMLVTVKGKDYFKDFAAQIMDN